MIANARQKAAEIRYAATVAEEAKNKPTNDPATKDSFAESEWAVIKDSPHYVHAAIVAADGQSGLFEARRETNALADYLSGYAGENALIKSVIAVGTNTTAGDGKSADDIKWTLSDIASYLSTQTDQAEYDAFMKFLLGAGGAIAEAHSEKLFNRRDKVSDEEAEALDSIAIRMNASAQARLDRAQSKVYEIQEKLAQIRLAVEHGFANKALLEEIEKELNETETLVKQLEAEAKREAEEREARHKRMYGDSWASSDKEYMPIDEAVVEEMVEMEEWEEWADDDDKHDLIPVYFATNRDKVDTGDSQVKAEFTGKFTSDINYGKALVSMPKERNPGELNTPRFFEKPDPDSHILVMTLDVLDETAFFADANSSLKEDDPKEALVFIHGFNVSFDRAVRLTAQVTTDIEFKGIPITYSWPSFAKAWKYFADENNIDKTQLVFNEFLKTLVEKLEVTKIHLLAHSMGNRLLSNGMAQVTQQVTADKLGQVIFASPDVDADKFELLAKQFDGKAEGYTLYINESDLALELSELLHSGPRAGERDSDPLVVQPVETIDATKISASFLGHSFYQRNETVLGDITDLIIGKLSANQRNLTEINVAQKRYWEILQGS